MNDHTSIEREGTERPHLEENESLSNEHIIDKLREIPAELRRIEYEKIDLTKKLEALEKQQKFIEIETRREVENATDPETGKAKYTNQRARDDATFEQLQSDPVYEKLKDKITLHKELLSKKDIEIKYEWNLHKSYRAIARLRSAGD